MMNRPDPNTREAPQEATGGRQSAPEGASGQRETLRGQNGPQGGAQGVEGEQHPRGPVDWARQQAAERETRPEVDFWADAAAHAATGRDTACAALNRVTNLADRIEEECALEEAKAGLTPYDGGRRETARHIHTALQPPPTAHNAGPSVAECARDDAHWTAKYAGEGQ
ncbi:hypothetical protein ACIP6X_02275 [Streptomyces coeruleorubidus]|uniref:hypothetical protein n=1 Tax=Streptomyces coeruleorubidus TaxID=116188 RepID=UPI003824A94A